MSVRRVSSHGRNLGFGQIVKVVVAFYRWAAVETTVWAVMQALVQTYVFQPGAETDNAWGKILHFQGRGFWAC